MNTKTKTTIMLAVGVVFIGLSILFIVKFLAWQGEQEETQVETQANKPYTKEEKLSILDKNKPTEELTIEKKDELLDRLDTMSNANNKTTSALDKLNAMQAQEDEAKTIEMLELLKNQ